MTEKNLFTSLPYLIFISLITLVIWYFGQQQLGMFIVQNWGLLAFAFVIFILLLAMKNTIYIVPLMLNMLFMISQTEWDITLVPYSLFYVAGLLIVGMILHVIIYKTNIFRGAFFIGIAVLFIAVVVSTIINTTTYNLFTLLIFLVAIFFVLLYGFFANTIRGEHLVYLIRIFTVLGVLISVQVAIFYLRQDDIAEALRIKDLTLGWGISNFIATYLIMFISATVYFFKKYKLHIFWIIVILFEITMLLFTLSRAGIIAFMGTTVLLLIFMFVKYPHKWTLLLNLVIGIVIVGVVAYFIRDYFYAIWERLDLYGLDDNGRIEIWKEAWATFKSKPFFGGGLFARETADNYLGLFHNTILEILACFGLLGGLALLIQFISILRIFFSHLTQEKAILLIALVGANMHGMVDNIYLMPQYMIIMFIIIAFVENANRIDMLREELSVTG